MSDATYLGDSVYIEPDGYDGAVIYLNNGETNPIGEPLRKSAIVLETEVLWALKKFLDTPAK